MVNNMSIETMSRMTRPEDGERGLGASHRRGGTGWASYRRPPEGLVKALDRVESPTSKAPGAERKVESMRDKGAKRPASWKLHIDDGCMGRGEAMNYLPVLAWSMGRNSVCMPGSDNDFWDVKWGNSWDVKWGNSWDVNNDNKVNIEFDNINGHFNYNRFNIFHYCIFGSEIWLYDKHHLGFRDSRSIGQGVDHDDIIIDYEYCKNTGFFGYSESYIISRLFMHELGHNIGLGEGFGGSKSVMARTNGWDVDLDYYSAWSRIDYYYSKWRNTR